MFSSSYITQEFKEVIFKIQFSVILKNFPCIHQIDSFSNKTFPGFGACATMIEIKLNEAFLFIYFC